MAPMAAIRRQWRAFFLTIRDDSLDLRMVSPLYYNKDAVVFAYAFWKA